MYKDKDKQREAIKEATRRYRAKKGDSALSGQKDSPQNARGLPVIDEVGDTQPVIPLKVIPKQDVTLVMTMVTPKRGKDIKCFEDLPLDVQETIDKMSLFDGKIDHVDKAKRTAAAIKYQRIFPDRFKPDCGLTCRGAVVTGKPGDTDYNGICTKEWRDERGR